LKHTPIRKVSKKMAEQKRQEAKLTQELLYKCGGVCEICNQWSFYGLSKHEIIFRGRGGNPCDPLNCLMLCRNCHNHVKYPMTGTPLSTAEQLEIAKNR